MEESTEKKFALILAGGKGSRLWPISVANKPKQFLNLYSDNIMINETIKRIEPLFEYENIFVITSIEQRELSERYIDSKIPRENIIYEPMSKNTAMCIFYASIKILNQKGNGTITVLSSDHYISNQKKLLKNIEEGIDLANKNENLVTIGIKPTYPATGFGYIKYNYDNNLKCNVVEEFKEKPAYLKAKEYIENGKYCWNSGMFIWKISTILNNYRKFLPEIYNFKEQITKSLENQNGKLEEIYKIVKSISIDKGILEKANNIKMIKGEFEWSDIGSINDFFDIREKDLNNNVKIGNLIARSIEDCNIYNENKNMIIAVVGTKNLNIINSNNVILISDKDRMDELSSLLEKIKDNKDLEKFL